MKKRFPVLISILLVGLLLLAACGGGAPSLVGKWSGTEPTSGTKVTIEFKADGKLAMGAEGIVMDVGTYKVLSASQVELNLDFMGTQQTQTINYRLEGNKLIMADPTDPANTIELTRE